MRNMLKSFRHKGSFTQNFALLFSSNILALAIGFLFTPIIARIYTPEAYGIFALFNALVQTIGNVATLQLTRGFVIPKREEEFHGLLRLTLVSSLIFILLSFIFLFLAEDFILNMLNAEKLKGWIIFIPVAILANCLNDILRSWNIRVAEFRRGAISKILTVISTRTLTVAYGLITSGSAFGLIIGDFLARPIDAYFLTSQSIKKNLKVLSYGYDFDKLLFTLRKFSSYPLYVLPGNWLNNFSNQLPVYLLIGAFDPAIAGFYGQANSLLNIPMMLLASSIAPLFLQKSSSLYHQNPLLLSALVVKLYKRLFYLGVIPFCLLSVFGKEIFYLFLGEQWINSGVFASYMGVYFVFWVISAPLNSLYRIYSKEHWGLVLNIISIIAKASGIYIGVLNNDFYLSILLFSIASLFHHLLQICVAFYLVGAKFYALIFKSILVMIFCYGIFYLFRQLLLMNELISFIIN
jgi:O-antigen/teichoic acid export membrane protein